MRYLAIGDIHGNYLGLRQCLERCDFDENTDTLIGIGDYTDGKPQSAEVVHLLSSLKYWIGIRGNHDIWAAEWLENKKSQDIWLSQGGKAMVKSYELNPDLKARDNLYRHQRFFQELHDYYILDIGQKYAFVHAGWTSVKGLGHEEDHTTYYWDRKLWEFAWLYRPDHGDPYINKRWKWEMEPKYVFIGHTPTDQFRPNADVPVRGYHGKIINLDQGAGWSGRLTICDIETLECWQSDENLYPGQER